MSDNKNNKSAANLAKKELKKEKRDKILIRSFLYVALVATSMVLVFLTAHLLLTGYHSYIDSKAGYITELEIEREYPSSYWAGTYGLALTVSDFTEQLYEDFEGGEVARKDLFFDCIEQGTKGGNEIYASLSPDIDFDNLEPAEVSSVDEFIECSSSVDCADNTFTEEMSILVGDTNISGIPATHTKKFDGNETVFDLGVMNDSENLVYVTHLGDIQKGFNPNKTVNYQLMLPVPENTSKEYYFFTDPYDTCTQGGLGQTLNASFWGYVTNSLGDPIANASVNVAGYSSLTNEEGFFNFSFNVLPGTYNALTDKQGYKTSFTNVSVNYTHSTAHKNITLFEKEEDQNVVSPVVYGYVKDTNGNGLGDAEVSFGSGEGVSESSGYYEFNTSVSPGENPIIATKQGFDNYYSFLDVTLNTSAINHNITMERVEENYEYKTGPWRPEVEQIIQEQIEKGEDHWVSEKKLDVEVRQNTFVEKKIGLYNFEKSSKEVVFSLSKNLQDFVSLDKDSVSIPAETSEELGVKIYGTKPLGKYNGTLTLSGGIEQEIPVEIKVVEKRFPIEVLLMEIDIFGENVRPGEKLDYKLNMKNMLRDQGYKIDLTSEILKINNSEVILSSEKETEIQSSLTLMEDMQIPSNFSTGKYILKVGADYLNSQSSVVASFRVTQPVYMHSFFGIPVWVIFVFISTISFGFLGFIVYKKRQEMKKRYRIKVDNNTLPGPGEDTIQLGKVAESKKPAYYELEKLKTHAIVAGATGMGKSISAQVIAEEALNNDVAVIVFDPTAQWSGMLRKCTDKKMFAYYPKFGLKESDAKGYKGNVRQVKNEREKIDVEKHIHPGQIQVFTLNQLEPEKIDIFVANIVKQIFESSPEEEQKLKVLLVFDEVHRLLSRFGGSGEGFLQIERACREFRKWGMGVMLISQVLNDFVSEIKANINTQVQTRTLEETDLNRIKTKYGEDYLKSLVKAEVGVVMFQNAEYNRGRPYFVHFRPILHNTKRLSDEELDKYNKYNDEVDDLEYQIKQLEDEGVDIFDLKMELNLVKDKIMSGNFSVVDIYLEGLKPRIKKQWDKLGKKPKKKKTELVSEEEIKKSVKEAEEEREDTEEGEDSEEETENEEEPGEEEESEEDSEEEESGEESSEDDEGEDEEEKEQEESEESDSGEDDEEEEEESEESEEESSEDSEEEGSEEEKKPKKEKKSDKSKKKESKEKDTEGNSKKKKKKSNKKETKEKSKKNKKSRKKSKDKSDKKEE